MSEVGGSLQEIPGGPSRSGTVLGFPRPTLLERKRVEVGSRVEGIQSLSPLEQVNDEVGERGGEGLIGHLDAIGGGDHDSDLRAGFDTPEGDQDHHDGIDKLTADRRADGAGPEPAAFGDQFELGQGVAVGEFPGPIGDQAGDGEARNEAEDLGEGFLVVPAGGGRQGDGQLAHESEQTHAGETEPDCASGGGVAVDFGEDVSADVGNGEQKLGSADQQRPDLTDFGTDEVRNEQDGDESDGEEVKVSSAGGHAFRIADEAGLDGAGSSRSGGLEAVPGLRWGWQGLRRRPL